MDEGDFVEAGQVLANIQSDTLQAQLAEAEAQHRQALDAVTSAQAAIAARKSDKAAAEAVVAARQAEATARKQRLGRTETLTKQKYSNSKPWTMTAPRHAAVKPQSVRLRHR